MPLNHADPDDPRTLPLRMKRILAPTQPARGQLWLVQGGPGGSAWEDFNTLRRDMHDQVDDLDHYIIEHRGTGGQARLQCPQEQAQDSDGGAAITEGEWGDCVAHLQDAWGDQLDHFGTTDAAEDLRVAIDAVKQPQDRVFVWGISYGTYQLARYLWLAPDQADGVILEGISPPGASFVQYSQAMNRAGQALMEDCDQDPVCSERMGAPAWDVLQQTLDAIEAGHCAQLGATVQDFFVPFFGTLLINRPLRDLLPAMIHRLQRCNADDRAVWANAYRTLFTGPGDPNRLGPAQTLFFHVALSERWPTQGLSVEAAQQEEDGLLMSTALTLRIARRAQGWPTYPSPDPQYNALPPAPQTPILMLQGELDAATPVEGARTVAQHFDGPGQTYVEFPGGAHAVSDACGRQIAAQFLNNPAATLDTTCAQNSELPVFDIPADIAQFVFGTTDVWGDDL